MTEDTQIATPIDEATQLANLGNILSGMADPIARADDVSYLLDALYDDGADAGVLEAVQVNVGALANMIQQYAHVTDALKALAEKVHEQRETARRQLEDLLTAARKVDRSNPVVETLYEQVEQITFSWVSETWYDDMIEMISDQIGEVTPLEYYEVASLINLLTDGSETVSREDPLWTELKAWIDRAEAAAERLDGRTEEAES